MKVLVINVCLRPYRQETLFPVGLGYVASAIKRAGFDLEILDIDLNRYSDEQVEKLLRVKKYDVVALGCLVTGYKIVKNLVETIKSIKDVPVIVGNSVATSIPEILLSKTKADIAVIGEGEVTIVELLKVLDTGTPIEEVKGICFKQNGSIVATPQREIIQDVNAIPMIEWELFDMEQYIDKHRYSISEPYPLEIKSLRAMPVNTARGCIYKCGFCYHVFRGQRYRSRSPVSICNEIKYLKEKYGVNYIFFLDELTFYSRKQCSDLCDRILNENLQIFFIADCRGDLFKEGDVELARKLKRAGCCVLGYSLESADPDILKSMNKKLSLEEFSTHTGVCQEAGLTVVTSLVIGYPEETEETIKKTFDVCYENNIYPSTGYLTPQPGTPVYEYAVKTGKIKNEEEYLINVIGDRQDFRINLTMITQERIEFLVKEQLKRISNKLRLGFSDTNLLITGHYKQGDQKTFTKSSILSKIKQSH